MKIQIKKNDWLLKKCLQAHKKLNSLNFIYKMFNINKKFLNF